MAIEGGCYCGQIRFRCDGDIVFKGQCHCRECQYIAGGGPNYAMGLPADQFEFTKGQPKEHRRSDLEAPATRLFCEHCGTHIASRNDLAPGVVILKVGTLDDPTLFDAPDHVIWVSEKQPFHHIPEGAMTFPGFPEH